MHCRTKEKLLLQQRERNLSSKDLAKCWMTGGQYQAGLTALGKPSSCLHNAACLSMDFTFTIEKTTC
jgi:hypothetical protein